MHERLTSTFRKVGLAMVLGLAGAAGIPAPSWAQNSDEGFVAQANANYVPIPAQRRSDLVILPLAAKMAPPPAVVATHEQAVITPADVPSFAGAAQWATAPEQQAVLKALREVTKETDWRRAHAFALPYGADAAPPELVRLGLYTDLGDPPTLAAARHLYLPALDRIGILVNVEATRLAGEGKPSDAIDTLTDWAFFCRSMCDREFFAEATWGLRNLADALHRIRDVAYEDMIGRRVLDQVRLLSQLQRIARDGYLDLERMTFPRGDRLGAEQMLARVYIPRAGVDARIFGTAMAKLGAGSRPLRIFSETASWRDRAAMQVDYFVMTEKIRGVYDDWADRWKFAWFDRRHNLKPVWNTIETPDAYAVLTATTPDMSLLGQQRQIVRVEAAGTRAGLGVVGATYARQSFPPQLSAIRPRWVPVLDDDPYNPTARDINPPQPQPLEYFVPMRDTPRNARGEPEPYVMDVVTTDPAHPLTLRMTDDTFVIYSWGSDNAKNFARRTQNTHEVVQGADYLLWPPVWSLQRKNLRDLGRLK
jgi:hypothetical protein